MSALTHEGAGVVRSGKTVFVPLALPGELIEFRRRGFHRQHDEAELVNVLRPAPERVVPRCAHFGVCGGCSLQHLSADGQRRSKQQELAETLERVGRVVPDQWLAPLAGPDWNYRRRARLGVKYVPKKGRVLVGFRERAKPYIADLTRCEILATPVDVLITPLAKLIDGLSVRAQLPQIEVAVGDATTVLVLRVLQELTSEDRAQLLEFEQAHGVRFFLQPGGPETVVPLAEPAPRLHYRLADEALEFDFNAVDFVQVNAVMNQRMVKLALELLAPDRQDRVLDLFCGLGNFTLPLAQRAAQVVGVEASSGAIDNARANAARNRLANVEFHCADLFSESLSGAWMQQKFARVLLDPPRAGAREVLPVVAALAPKRIVYVSCHAATLARDLGLLVHEHGFRLLAAGLLDMFPHTTHLESIALLEAHP